MPQTLLVEKIPDMLERSEAIGDKRRHNNNSLVLVSTANRDATKHVNIGSGGVE